MVFAYKTMLFLFVAVLSGLCFSVAECVFELYVPNLIFFVAWQLVNVSVNVIFGIILLFVSKALSSKLKNIKFERPFFLLSLCMVFFNVVCAAILKANKMTRYGLLNPWNLAIDVALTIAVTLICILLYRVGVRLLSGMQPRKTAVCAFVFLVSVSVATAEMVIGQRYKMEEYAPKSDYAAKRNAPNIFFFLVDTFRFERLHCFGNPRELSNTLDAMFSESVNFTRAYSQSSWTKPSVASLFTGLYPHQHGALKFDSGLSRELVTYTEVFREYGYDTAAFSANIIVSPHTGMDHGFEYFHYNYGQYMFKRTVYGAYISVLLKSVSKHAVSDRRGASEEAKSVFERVEKWIAGHGENPFMAYIHLMDLHGPYAPPKKYVDMFLADDAPSADFKELKEELLKYADNESFFRPEAHIKMSDPRLVALRDLYDAQIAYLDDQFEMIFEKMKRKGLFENSIIVIAGDHGEDFGDHGHVLHGNHVYNTLIRVPFMIRFPNNEYAKEIEAPISLFDAFPTIAEYIDMPVPKGLEAVSRLEEVVTGKGSVSGPVHSHYRKKISLKETVLNSKWKLIRSRNIIPNRTMYELFDMERDFYEDENLSDKNDEIVKKMVAELDEIKKKKKHAKPVRVDMNSEMKEKLRQLGYVK